MVRNVLLMLVVLGAVRALAGESVCQAGMPAPLPTGWKADAGTPDWADHAASSNVSAARCQALSFFIALLLLSAWGLKAIWNSLGTQFVWLPRLGYWRSLGLVGLWGLCFIVVLVMISGARELMTPGAWKQQGWTYKLADAKPPDPVDQSAARRHALEQLRFALWNYAASHDGRFPSPGDPAIDAPLWEIPGWAGLRYLYVADRAVDSGGRLLAYEPNADGNEARLVLLTNGLVGTMRTSEIDSALNVEQVP